jgi:hypothetical protein
MGESFTDKKEEQWFKVGEKMGKPSEKTTSKENPLGGKNKVYTGADTDAWVTHGVTKEDEEETNPEERMAA